MQADDFNELRAEVFRLYGAGQIEEALATMQRGATTAKGDAGADLVIWRVYLEGRLGRKQTVLEILREAAANGYLYSENRFRNVQDLAALQGDPEFELLVQRFAAMRADAEKEAANLPPLMPCIVRGAPLLIALHGNSSSPKESAAQWVGAAKLGWSVVLPHSSQVGLTRNSYLWDDRTRAQAQLGLLWSDLAHRLAPPITVVAGFSMGAQVAMWVVLTGAVPGRGFLAVAPFFQQLDLSSTIERAKKQGSRGYMICGERDVENLADSLRISRQLSQEGLRCAMTTIPSLGHSYPIDFAEGLERALLWLTAGDTADR